MKKRLDLFKNKDDIAIITDTDNLPSRIKTLKKFVGTMNKTEGYTDSPFLLLSKVSAIACGVSLPPRDMIITLDGNFNSIADA